MKKKYLKLHEDFNNIFYNKEFGIEWFKNIEEYFDIYFAQRFEKTKNLGNQESYRHFEVTYKVLLGDFAELCFDYYQDMLESTQLIISLQKSNITKKDFEGILNSSKNLFNQSLTYQLILLQKFILRLSNIENLQVNEFFKNLKECRDKLYDTFRNDVKPVTESENELLKKRIKLAKEGLRSQGIRPTKLQVANKLGMAKSTFYTRIKKIDFDNL